MKIQELMVGDLVYSPYHCEVVRITGLMEDSGLCHVESTKGTEFYLHEVNVSELEPIPLAADVLQKIGLRQLIIKGEQEYFVLPMVGYYLLTPEQRLHQSSCVFSISKGNNPCGWLFINTDEGRIEATCKHVHQLQHLFKHIGWDSEFKL